MQPLMETVGVNRSFGDFQVLTDVNVVIRPAELTIIKGRSGSGKTTLLNILSTLDLPDSGKVFFHDRELTGMPEYEKTILRRTKLGIVFQSAALNPVMTAQENVAFSLRLSRNKSKLAGKRVEECLRAVGMDNRMRHFPQELSGGEQQRVAIARAIVHKPELILADEPTAALDTDAGLRMVALFKQLIQKEEIGVIMTTHDPGLMELGDHVYEIEDGVVRNA